MYMYMYMYVYIHIPESWGRAHDTHTQTDRQTDRQTHVYLSHGAVRLRAGGGGGKDRWDVF
jgi:hypothetical protein